jgi:hypothetical protein
VAGDGLLSLHPSERAFHSKRFEGALQTTLPGKRSFVLEEYQVVMLQPPTETPYTTGQSIIHVTKQINNRYDIYKSW